MFDVVNNSPNGYKLSDIAAIFSFFIANAGSFLDKETGFKMPGGCDGWIELLSYQAKVLVKNFSSIHVDNLS